MEHVVVEWRRYLQRRRYSQETVWARVSNTRQWIVWVGDWRSATYGDVEDWVAARGVTPRVQRNLVSHLRAFYRWAMREGLTEHDPTALVDAPRVASTLPRPAREADIAALLATATDEVAAMVALMSCGGLRCVEVARLRWDDVDLVAGTLTVMGKGLRERTVHVGDEVLELLARLDTSVGAVFVPPRARTYTAARVSKLINAKFRASGLATTAHQLRHRAATTALEASGDLMAVRDFLGHSSVATTQIYTKVVAGSAAAASRAVMLPRSA